MTIRVYDYRTDLANLVVHPEIRGRFRRVEPGPAPRMHSHDIAGEIFLVLTGRCEFLVEDERVTCGPGQLIYVEPRVKHALHAVGDEPCAIYLSVTPHVEPTHTLYDEDGQRLPPRYGTWRGAGQGATSPYRPGTTLTAAEDYVEAADQTGRPGPAERRGGAAAIAGAGPGRRRRRSARGQSGHGRAVASPAGPARRGQHPGSGLEPPGTAGDAGDVSYSSATAAWARIAISSRRWLCHGSATRELVR